LRRNVGRFGLADANRSSSEIRELTDSIEEAIPASFQREGNYLAGASADQSIGVVVSRPLPFQTVPIAHEIEFPQPARFRPNSWRQHRLT
jgi:hypothetical protein